MKKLSLLLFLLAAAGALRAATVSGVVTSATTCGPVSGQKVYLSDSNSLWIDSAVTNSSGAYSVTIPSSLSPSGIEIRSNACGAVYSNFALYPGTSINLDLVICGRQQVLSGAIRFGTSMGSGAMRVYLIRRDVDPVTLDTSLVAIDSTLTVGAGGFNFRLTCRPAGHLLVKAALLPSNPAYASYLPTCWDSSLTWNGARGVDSIYWMGWYVNMTMRAGVNPGGPGFIGGSVLVGANKSTAVGDPLNERVLIITNAATGQAVAMTKSDASGQFRFPSLAYGSYKIFGDAWGKYNPALTVTLSAAKPSVNNIIFEENNKKFEGHIGSLGAGTVAALSGVSLYPNPATDFVALQGLANIKGSKTVILSSLTGAEISRQTITGSEARVQTAALPAGMYLLQVHTESGSTVLRFAK